MIYIDECINCLQQKLPNNWLDQLTQENKTEEQITIDLGTALSTVAQDFFSNLNLSVICGEYVKKEVGINNAFLKIESYLDTIADFEIAASLELSNACQDIFQSTFREPIIGSLKKYKSLLSILEPQLKYKAESLKIFGVYKSDRNQPNNATNNLSIFFAINVALAKIDHTIRFDKNCFKDLLILKHDLTHFPSQEIYTSYLLDKCNFLLFKIAFRLKEGNKNYLYSIDFNYSEVDLTDVPKFSKFTSIIYGHYSESNVKPQRYSKRVDQYYEKISNGTPLTLDDFHCMIKHYKDKENDLDKLLDLQTKFDAFIDSKKSAPSLSPFDKRAFEISTCYLANNILSLKIEKGIFTLDNYEIEFQSFIRQQDSFSLRNFFPHFKLLKDFLKINIDNEFQNENWERAKIERLINGYEKYLNKLNENIGICSENNYLAFQLNYDECLLEYEGLKSKAFISSSFVLPINYPQLANQVELLKSELIRFKTMYEIQKFIDVDKKDIKRVKEEIERNDKRHVEILSIFSALVMFVSGDIQIFSRVNDIADAVIFMLLFAFALSNFVLMIWFITRPEAFKRIKLSKMHIAIITLFSIGLCISLGFVAFIKLYKSDNQKVIEQLNFKIDSIQKANTIDTLSRIHDTKKSGSKIK